MVLRVTGLLTAVLLSAVIVRAQEAQAQQVDVTGAWDVTIIMSGNSASGLAVLSHAWSRPDGHVSRRGNMGWRQANHPGTSSHGAHRSVFEVRVDGHARADEWNNRHQQGND